MKVLQRTLFIIACLILTTQTVRHAYIKWFRPAISVLDKFEEPLKEDIKKAKTLEELVKKYEDAHKKVTAYEAVKTNPPIEQHNKMTKEPYKSENALKEAIKDWESKSSEIHELRFYWAVGFLLLVSGYFAYVKFNQWAGMSLLITGFSEMIYWTSTSFIRENSIEFERLLTNKFFFSLFSLLLLIVVALGLKIMVNGSPKGRDT